MIIIDDSEQYECVLVVLALLPDELERTDEENIIACRLGAAVDRYERRYYPIVERADD
jgi:hypothetical protein